MTDGYLDVRIHASQFPDQQRAALFAGIARREIPAKFHYETARQARAWLAVHEAHSPARSRARVAGLYEEAARAVAGSCSSGRPVVLVGLGPGGGHKESAVAAALVAQAQDVRFLALDSSVPLVIEAWHRVERTLSVPGRKPPPSPSPAGMACDLAAGPELAACVAPMVPPEATGIVTCFGVLPNMAAKDLLPGCRALLQPGWPLLLSVNMLPEDAADALEKRILPQYQNPETEAWLRLLAEEACEPADAADLAWRAAAIHEEEEPSRIEALLRFGHPVQWSFGGTSHRMDQGEVLSLFRSYRYTRPQVGALFSRHGLAIKKHWIDPQGEEGVFWCEAD